MRVAAAGFFGQEVVAGLGHIHEDALQLFTAGDTAGEEAEGNAARGGLVCGYQGLGTPV